MQAEAKAKGGKIPIVPIKINHLLKNSPIQ